MSDAPVDQPEGPVGEDQPMSGDDVRGPEGEELEWPQPLEEPEDWEEKGESLANDETPGAAPTEE